MPLVVVAAGTILVAVGAYHCFEHVMDSVAVVAVVLVVVVVVQVVVAAAVVVEAEHVEG